MKRMMILALGLAMFAPIGLVGCGEETKTTEKVSTPTGTDTKEVKETKTGDMKDNK